MLGPSELGRADDTLPGDPLDAFTAAYRSPTMAPPSRRMEPLPCRWCAKCRAMLASAAPSERGCVLDRAIGWIQFVGAWLLVVGPLLQAAKELLRGLHESDDGQRAPTSLWWWLVPPVVYALHRRSLTRGNRSRASRDAATGWFAVSGGGLALAFGETWSVSEAAGWGPGWFVALFAGTLAATLAYTSARVASRIRGSAA